MPIKFVILVLLSKPYEIMAKQINVTGIID